MNMMRFVASHPTFISKLEKAARLSQSSGYLHSDMRWLQFRSFLDTLDINSRVLPRPAALMCVMDFQKARVYTDFLIIMSARDSDIPWCANLNALCDYRRVGLYSVSWAFNKDTHKKMVKEGFNVATNSETA